jgi:hypothetical protein
MKDIDSGGSLSLYLAAQPLSQAFCGNSAKVQCKWALNYIEQTKYFL